MYACVIKEKLFFLLSQKRAFQYIWNRQKSYFIARRARRRHRDFSKWNEGGVERCSVSSFVWREYSANTMDVIKESFYALECQLNKKLGLKVSKRCTLKLFLLRTFFDNFLCELLSSIIDYPYKAKFCVVEHRKCRILLCFKTMWFFWRRFRFSPLKASSSVNRINIYCTEL